MTIPPPDDGLWEIDVEPIPVMPTEITGSDLPPPQPPSLPPPLKIVEEEPPPSPVQIVEALLFVGGAPLTAERACEVVRALTPEHFCQLIDELNQRYRRQNRPYTIQLMDQAYQLTVKPKYRFVREKMFGSPREARLSQPALDVLALVAHRQPVTKTEVDNLRGVESASVLRQLVRLGLIMVVQRGEAKQPSVFYGTTSRFLELFQLRSLDDLPQTGEVQRL